MRQVLERAVYELVFVEDGGLIAAGEDVKPFGEARRVKCPTYQLAAKVTERVLWVLRTPSDAVVHAMSDVVLSDGDIREEWQAGIDAAGKR